MGTFKMTGKAWTLAIMAAFILGGSSAYAQGIDSFQHFKNNLDGSQVLLNHVPKAVTLGLATKMTPVGSSQILDLRVILPSKDQAGLDSLIKDLYNPKSPMYHKFLTHKQVIQQFGADSVNSSLVIEQLKSYGLTVTSQSDDGCILRVSGTVSAVERMLKLNINNYKRKSDGKQFFAPDADPTVPTQMAGKINWIAGMSNLHRYHPHHYRKKYSGTPVKAPAPKAAVSSLALKAVAPVTKAASPAFSGPDGTVAPSDLLTAYNLSSVSSTGTGQTQALFELDGFVRGDITEFTDWFSLSVVPPITVVPVDGGITTIGEGIGEVDLDIDLTIAVAPGLSSIRVYEANQDTNPNAWIDEWSQIFTEDNAQIVSCSWGASEDGPDQAHMVFEEMAAQGQTIFAASGDSGAYDNCSNATLQPQCTDGFGDTITPILSVDDPASDPYVTGVGISILSVNGSEAYVSETASHQGGGGISSVWPISDSNYSFQTGVAAQTALAHPAGKVSTTMRNVPDLVFTSDPATPYWIWISDPEGGTGWYTVWGSSAASPIWAAFISRVNHGRAVSLGGPNPLGWLNPAIYQIYTQNQSTCTSTPSLCDYHDITTSNNSFYPAEPGYDDASGLGSFNGVNLYNDLSSGLPGPPTTVTAQPGNATATVTFSNAWADGSAITGYTVTSSPDGFTNSGASSPLTVSGLTNGTPYTFTVTSTNMAGTGVPSVPSNSVIPGTPVAPTSLVATRGNLSATVSFTPGADNGSAILSYIATSTPGGRTGSSATIPVTVSGLTNGTSYTFTVTESNSFGMSPASLPSNSVIPAGPPLPPTTVTAVAGSSQATVTFSGASANGSPILSYTVTSNPAGGSNSGSTSPITVTGLTNFRSYTFTVTATNTVGTGSASAPSNSVTPTPVAAPTNLSDKILAVKLGGQILYGGVVLTWVQSIGPGIITENKIYRSTGAGAYSLLATIGKNTTYTDKNMSKGVVYNYKVTAYTSLGSESQFSTVVAVNY